MAGMEVKCIKKRHNTQFIFQANAKGIVNLPSGFETGMSLGRHSRNGMNVPVNFLFVSVQHYMKWNNARLGVVPMKVHLQRSFRGKWKWGNFVKMKLSPIKN